MKQKQQTKNKHSGPSSRSDQCIMDKQNRLKSTLEGKINRIETFIESANEETDSVEIKVKLRSLIQLQKNAEKLRNNYYAIPNVKDAELTALDEDLHLLEVRLESLENIKWKLKTIISNEDSSFAEPVDFLIVDKITEFTPSSSLDISNVEIPKFLTGFGDTRDDPVLYERDQAIEIFKETVEFEKGRYIVQLPFRKSYNELFDNYPLAKQRFQNLWRRFGHDSELYQQYREIIRDYTEQGIIEVKPEITDNKLKRPVYYLPHQAIKKDGRLTSKRRIVFDAGSHQNNELSLNDCLWPGINLNPNLLDILINFRLNAIAFCSDIKQAFLQICLADEHKDAVRFLWSDDEPCVHKRPKLQVYRFNRVNFGVSSSPFLLAATIRHHIERYKHEFPDTVELLDRNFYVDDLISGGNEFDEALQTSRRAKNIMEAAGMDLRKWITNDANLMEQWKKENFNVHPVHETVSLGANGTKVLGLSWNTNEDYLTTDTKSLLEFVSLDKNTKRFILQAVGKIFDPLGLISPFTVRMKCLLQDLWKEEIQWDDPLPTHIEKEWKKWCEELPHLRNLKIPRLVLDSTLLEDNVELHSFCDASKKAYGAAIYLRTKSRNGISVKLVTSKSRVLPLNCVTLSRLELLGALVAARLASKVKKIVNLERSCLQYHWTDSKIVLFWIKGNKTRWKQFVANRVNEITSLTDPHSWYHCAGKENPADFLSRGLSADCLVSNSRWWTDGEGIVRVGGRLENASVPYLHKHPAILPKGSKLSKLYFNSLHTRLFHVGPQGLLHAVRQKFWPLSGRSIARKTVHQCVTCFKSRLILSSQIMGNLPSERVNISSPFTIAGLDLCGPFLVKYKNQRKRTLNKVYICVCICFSTKAIHLELLSDLTSDALIATLKRFTSRRAKYFVSENIDWKFIPPKSPHFGGLWEAGVKSVKHHLKRAIGNLHFTFEEFETFLIQVEGILNSRPLTPLSSDADNFDVLTPGHFLIGRPITSIPEPNLIDVNENRLSRREKITKVVQRTWKKWKSDYLNTLQARSKWITEKNDLMIGQMVLIKEDFLPINTWPLGRILEVYHGSDGKVRVVKVKTQSGEFKRAISKIAVLPIDTK
ncbi:integrase catalytic domain-containing protein [Trichonephila clavipes]|nr:integrase catalytic domain-containing protein [Trichonephila clavipes]